MSADGRISAPDASPGSVASDALNRGATGLVSPVFGIGAWGGTDRFVPFEAYDRAWGPPDRSIFRAETLLPVDVDYLRWSVSKAA